MAKQRIEISHFSDVLCVWAYIAQIRIGELQSNYADEVQVNYHFLQVFGDVHGKMQTQWADRGGLDGYAAHVQEVAAKFPHIKISPQAWLSNTPASSLPAHIALCGLRVMHAAQPTANDDPPVEQALVALRQAFFVDTVDISAQAHIDAVLAAAGINIDRLRETLNSGRAHALFAADLAAATQSSVKASPTLSFNEGRQVLAGNVGYRILEANVHELLRHPADQQSWC